VTDGFDYRLQTTDRHVRDLDGRLDDLESEQESLKTRFGYTDDLDDALRVIRNDVSECEEQLERADSRIERVDDRVDEMEGDLGGRVAGAEQDVKRLTQHVRLLEGQIMAAGGAPAADLDTYTADQRALARTMQSGWNAADVLLSDHSRTLHRARVERFKDTQARHQAARTTVIDLVGALTSHRYDTAGHTQAATQLRAAIATEATLRQGIAQRASEARESADALAADTATRADQQPAIAAGDRAEQRLTMALRSRLADAVSSRSLLPAWFVTVLGSAPPARETDRWLECATRLLLYRLAYGIDDQVLALGPAPTVARQHRHAWYDELSKDLRGW
jgi:chromosome segregation ATPase